MLAAAATPSSVQTTRLVSHMYKLTASCFTKDSIQDSWQPCSICTTVLCWQHNGSSATGRLRCRRTYWCHLTSAKRWSHYIPMAAFICEGAQMKTFQTIQFLRLEGWSPERLRVPTGAVSAMYSTVQHSNCGRGSQTSAPSSEPRAHEGAQRPVAYVRGIPRSLRSGMWAIAITTKPAINYSTR